MSRIHPFRHCARAKLVQLKKISRKIRKPAARSRKALGIFHQASGKLKSLRKTSVGPIPHAVKMSPSSQTAPSQASLVHAFVMNGLDARHARRAGMAAQQTGFFPSVYFFNPLIDENRDIFENLPVDLEEKSIPWMQGQGREIDLSSDLGKKVEEAIRHAESLSRTERKAGMRLDSFGVEYEMHPVKEESSRITWKNWRKNYAGHWLRRRLGLEVVREPDLIEVNGKFYVLKRVPEKAGVLRRSFEDLPETLKADLTAFQFLVAQPDFHEDIVFSYGFAFIPGVFSPRTLESSLDGTTLPERYSDAFIRALQSLTPEELERELGNHLTALELKALLFRRQMILEASEGTNENLPALNISGLKKEISSYRRKLHFEESDEGRDALLKPYLDLLAVLPPEEKVFLEGEFEFWAMRAKQGTGSVVLTARERLLCRELIERFIRLRAASFFKEPIQWRRWLSFIFSAWTAYAGKKGEFRDYITEAGELDLNRLLADKRHQLNFYPQEYSEVQAARGLISSLGIQEENIHVAVGGEGVETDLMLKKIFPGVSNQLTDHRRIVISFDDNNPDVVDRSDERQAPVQLSRDPFKYKLPAAMNPNAREALREALGLGKRKLIFASSFMHHKQSGSVIEDIVANFERAFAGKPESEKPVLIIALRHLELNLAASIKSGRSLRMADRTEEDQAKPDAWMAGNAKIGELDVVFLNTMGEGPTLMGAADLGISEKDRNIFELASQNLPILFFDGEYANNFMAKELVYRSGGGIPIRLESLDRQMVEVLANPTALASGSRQAVRDFNERVMPAMRLFAALMIGSEVQEMNAESNIPAIAGGV